ncbi:MAG: CsoR family transcriptional regulator, copper-sensing transcriptional repressor [Candidatus Atribacteria bacterium]|jgi:DNA-binding FrmR family transcriptional regulator|nr:CsoR family transcriptional regulator, copper-sensing transcriptional repressor [Candidatus Atribacteria bacterium]
MGETKNSNSEDNQRRFWSDEKVVKEILVRLNRIEGQVRGIKRMVEEEAYCDDILNQIASIQSALYGVARLLLEKHMKSCVKEQILSGDEGVIDEVLATIFRMMK